jgi:hypothetical protein
MRAAVAARNFHAQSIVSTIAGKFEQKIEDPAHLVQFLTTIVSQIVSS